MKQAKILLLDLPPISRQTFHHVLTANCQVEDYSLPSSPSLHHDEFDLDKEKLAEAVARLKPDLIFWSLRTDSLAQFESLHAVLKYASNDAPLIAVIEETIEPRQVFEILKCGFADYLTTPLNPVNILPRAWRLLKASRSEDLIAQSLKEKMGLNQLVGRSPTFLAAVEKIPLIAKCDVSVIISGETGTGKELYARAIHYLGPRAAKPFIPVNCGAIPTELVENELFGHERGAFTGANASQHGLLREAEGGTLFLDEVDCLPPMAQIKFLRFLQEKEYRPLGCAQTRKADVRVLAATNVDLLDAIREGRMRKDLYYRLNVICLTLPPLRERQEDIAPLACHFLDKYATEFDKPMSGFAPEAMQSLLGYDWPGNVRELEHVVERAVVLAGQGTINSTEIDIQGSREVGQEETFQNAKSKFVEQFEKNYIQRLLLAHSGNITHAAHAARKNRRAFWQLIHKHNIDAKSFKTPAL
ncbi:MAG: sigma-54 dependent transcriptional regulator [Pyrinomonadaceae bacterium]